MVECWTGELEITGSNPTRGNCFAGKISKAFNGTIAMCVLHFLSCGERFHHNILRMQETITRPMSTTTTATTTTTHPRDVFFSFPPPGRSLSMRNPEPLYNESIPSLTLIHRNFVLAGPGALFMQFLGKLAKIIGYSSPSSYRSRHLLNGNVEFNEY